MVTSVVSSVLSCAACGDQEALELALQQDGNIVDVAGKGFVGLLHAFLQQGADVEIQDNKGRTALLLASGGGHIECVRYLIESGKADVGIQNIDGMTALMYASRGGHIECVRYLVESGKAYVGIQDNDGWTALKWASNKGHTEVCEYLKSKGARIA